MAITYLLPAILILHVTGLILMAGTTLIDFITLKKFWKLFATQKLKAEGVLEYTAVFPRLIGIGAAALIVTGFLMMFITHGVFGEQLWFRIKFILVILLVANGVLIGRRLGVKLRKTVLVNDPATEPSLEGLRKKIFRFHTSQLVIFILIIFLSIFKFN